VGERLESRVAGSRDEDQAGIGLHSPTAGASDDGLDPRRPRRRGRRLAAAGILVAAGVAVAVVLLSPGSRPSGHRGNTLPPGETTTTVGRRTLTESSTVEGTLGYGAKVDLYNRLAGTFTWLPTVGDVVRRGGTLWRIDNRPVALMYGPVPAYRTLKEGVGDGPDVAELNRNLIDLGFDRYGGIEEDAHFGAATADAVRRWQESEHLPQTGKVELGRIVFAPGARRVTALEVVVGQDPPPIGQAKEAPAQEPAAEEPAPEEPAGHKPSAEEPEAQEPAGSEPAAEEPEAGEPTKEAEAHEPTKEPEASEPTEQPAADEQPGGENENPGSGQEPAAAEAALATTSTRQLVQLELGAAEQSLAKVGKSAPVTLPDGDVVKGRITEVGKVAEAAEGGGPEGGGEEAGEATISVTVALDHPVARLDEAPVSVELVKQVSRHVLAVPATALFATAGGDYAVEALKDGRRVRTAVTPGMFADGYVQVEGHGIHAGLKVTEPSEE
jgi:peptidoglycan hydrolase-like protein with peptidoglycan-binding domain